MEERSKEPAAVVRLVVGAAVAVEKREVEEEEDGWPEEKEMNA